MAHRRTKSEPNPLSQLEIVSTDLITDAAQQVDITSQSSRLVKPEQQFADRTDDDTSFSSSRFELEEHVVNDSQPRSTQSDSDVNNWTVTELRAAQQANHRTFVEQYHTIAIQERLRLAQAEQGELKSGMNQIFGYIKSVIERPTQPSDSVEVEKLRNLLKAERTHTRDLGIRYNGLVRSSDQQKMELQKANTRLQDALRERDQLRQLLNGGNLANSGKASDAAIKSKWGEIAYNIRSLVHMLDGAPSAQLLDDEVTRRLRFISKDYRGLLQDPDLREFLLRGAIWTFIQDAVFDSKDCFWGGPDMEMYKVMRDNLITRIGEICDHPKHELPIPHVARWLAQGFTMMSEMWDKDSVTIKRMLHVEAKRMRPFTSDDEHRMDRADNKVFEHLKDIVHTAIELDQMMMCSKAIFQIHWRDQSQNPGQLVRWNPEVMEADGWEHDLSKKSRVRFYVSPILYKTGSADGQGYDSQMVLAKGKVICD